MTITVNGPNGLTINFPEGTTPDIINKVMLEATTGKKATEAAAGPDVSMAEDIAKSAGAGVVRGGIGLASLPGTVEQVGRWGINKMFGKGGQDVVSPETALPTYKDVQGAVENKIGSLYEPKTRAGKYAGTAGEFATGMLFPGGGAAGVTSQIVNRGVRNVLAPAVSSETAGQLTEGTAAEPYARVAGALAGPLAMTPFRQTSATLPNAVETLRSEGVNSLTAGEVTGRKAVRYMESALNDVPLSGQRGTKLNAAAGEEFTAAALKRAGINARQATPEVIGERLSRFDNEFSDIASKAAVPITQPLVADVKAAAAKYEMLAQPQFRSGVPAALAKDIEDLASPTGLRFMTGPKYAQWRSDIGTAARGMTDDHTKRTLYDLQNKLDKAAEGFMRSRGLADDADKMKQVRREYRNFLVIERAATAAGEGAAGGIISPRALQQATKTLQGTRAYAEGKGDFAKLSRAGVQVMSPLPQSGTAPRLAAQHLVNASVGGAIGASQYGPEGGAYGFAAPLLAQALMGRVVLSKPGQAYLRNQMAAGPAKGIASNRALASAAATQTELSDKRKKDRR